MNETISYSFIMPAYKARFIHLAIESILNQSYRNFELIIVNDASPENIKAIVDSYADNRIIYKENETNIGGTDLVANWNHCIQFANKDYVILATDDDMFDPDFLSEATKIINKHPNSDLFRSGVKKIGEKGEILDEEFPLKEYLTSREFTLCWAKGLTISCVSNYIFKKCALDKIGGFISFPHAHFSDDATALAIAEHGVANMPSNFLNFRVSTINLSNQGDYRTAINQIIATDLYMGWYLKHVAKLDTVPHDYFEKACYGGCKSKCTELIEKLSAKIPISKSFLLFKTLLSLKHLFKNEKIKLCINYYINKL